MIFVETQVGKICLLFVVDAVMVQNIRKCRVFHLSFSCKCFIVHYMVDCIVCSR